MNRKRLALSLLLVAGCSSVHWEKPGATRDAVDSDLRACTTAAQAAPTLPALRTSPTGTEVLPHPTDRDADRQLQEGERVQNCMRSRGYTLRSG